MTQHRDRTTGQPFPESLLDASQEFVSTMASANFALEVPTANTIRIPAGTGNDQVSVGIVGRWRWITTPVTAAHPGGAAGIYDVYVTASDNSFSGAPETDNTNYSFALEIRASGATPTTALYRKVGTVNWNGSAIVGVQSLLHTGVSGAEAASGPVPVGTLFDWPWGEAGVPAGYLLCYGQAVSRTTYPLLHAQASAAGYPYGSGDGTTTFNLPDLRGRAIVGRDNMGGVSANRITAAWADTIGGSGGVETHPLAAGEVPNHTHTITEPNSGTGHGHGASSGAHSHGFDSMGDHWHYQAIEYYTDRLQGTGAAISVHKEVSGGTQIGTRQTVGAGAWVSNPIISAVAVGVSVNNAVTGITINPTTGGGGAHQNVQPSLAMSKIIRSG